MHPATTPTTNIRRLRTQLTPLVRAVRRGQQLNLDIHKEILVDCFAGGGGASSGIEKALGRRVDVAINHSRVALSVHQANHPDCIHYCEDITQVDPREVANGRPVGYVHLSPDCTHHSQAAGGQPRSKEIRGLAWQAVRWSGTVQPRIISIENVVQIRKWGPLIAKRDKATGRVMKLDGTVADAGERVPVQQQFLIPNPARAGRTWEHFKRALRANGYVVEDRDLCAADFGAPTTRVRLFMVARRDGRDIVWPEPSHAKNPGPGQKKWRAAAECIDWSIPSRSIFGRTRPLAEATLRRVAKGIKRFVIEAANPFIVPVTHQGSDRVHDITEPLRTVTGANRGELAIGDPIVVPIAHYSGRDTVHSSREPLRTIVASTKGGEFSLATPVLAKFRGSSIGTSVSEPVPTITAGGACKRPAGAAHALGLITPFLVQAAHGEGKPGGVKRWGLGAKALTDPLGTVTGSGGHAVAAAYLAQMNAGYNTTPGHPADRPMTTITNKGSQQQLVTAHLATLRNNCVGTSVDGPMATLTAGGEHHALVECILSPENEAAALRMADFMLRYAGYPADAVQGLTSIPDRLALVTVMVGDIPFVIVDIHLRMMDPRELMTAQGFPADYIIGHGHDGTPISKSAQVHLCGNSVSPVVQEAVVRANCSDLAIRRAA